MGRKLLHPKGVISFLRRLESTSIKQKILCIPAAERAAEVVHRISKKKCALVFGFAVRRVFRSGDILGDFYRRFSF